MNILITYENFNCGGAESRIFTLAKALIKRKHKVVILSKYGDYVKFFEDLGGIHYDIDFTNIYDLKNTINIIRGIIYKERINFIHLNPYFSIIAPVFVALYENIPFTVTIHGVNKNLLLWSENNNVDFYLILLKDLVFKYASSIISVSPEVTSYLKEEFGLSDGRIVYIPQYIDIEFFKGDEIKNQKNKFLLVSRIDEDKMVSINEALNFFKFYKLKNKKSKLDIVGTGYHKEKLINMIKIINKELNESCVNYLGNKPDLWNIINKYDIIIGMGRVVLEGLACNKIVILSGVDGIKDVVKPNNFCNLLKTNFSGRGILNKNYNEIIDKIYAINEQDISELQNLVLKNFSIDKWINEYEKIYLSKFNLNLEKDEFLTLIENLINNFILSKKSLIKRYYECWDELQKLQYSRFWKLYFLLNKIKKFLKIKINKEDDYKNKKIYT